MDIPYLPFHTSITVHTNFFQLSLNYSFITGLKTHNYQGLSRIIELIEGRVVQIGTNIREFGDD